MTAATAAKAKRCRRKGGHQPLAGSQPGVIQQTRDCLLCCAIAASARGGGCHGGCETRWSRPRASVASDGESVSRRNEAESGDVRLRVRATITAARRSPKTPELSGGMRAVREAIAVDVAAGARSGLRIAPPSANLKQTPYVRRGVPDGAYRDRGARPRAVVDGHLRRSPPDGEKRRQRERRPGAWMVGMAGFCGKQAPRARCRIGDDAEVSDHNGGKRACAGSTERAEADARDIAATWRIAFG